MADPVELIGNWVTNKPFTYSGVAVGGWERYVQLDFYIQYTLVHQQPSSLEVNVFADQAQPPQNRLRVDFVLDATPNLVAALVELKVYNWSTEAAANYWTRLRSDVLKLRGDQLALLAPYNGYGRWVVALANFSELRRAYDATGTWTFDQLEAHLATLVTAKEFDHVLYPIGPTENTWVVLSSMRVPPA
jgi:hypothetical protein